MLERVLVANRGECAVRIVRACHDLGIEAVAVYSTADRDGLWVELADRAVCIGPHQPAESYLNVQNLIGAAETTGCDALHPGWGFLAENAAFVGVCAENDLVFVGPPAEAMEVMGDKSRAREAMRSAGVPLVPGSLDRLGGADHARAMAAEIGYPVLLKAAAGGGGRGMRLVTDPADIEDAYGVASAEALTSFGDGGMYLERAVVGARHVEMQVLADDGGVLVLGERDCSVQRRHQKLIEEGPSPALDEATRVRMADAARLACTGLRLPQRRHRGVPARPGRLVLLHRDEHPAPGRAPGVRARDRPRPRRLAASHRRRRAARRDRASPTSAATRSSSGSTARTPRTTSAPRPARSARFRPPLGPGVRFDTHAYEGYRVPPFYDSLLAKLIVWGEDRAQALDRSRRALAELEIEGVATTAPLFAEVVGGAGASASGGLHDAAYLDDVREPACASLARPEVAAA